MPMMGYGGFTLDAQGIRNLTRRTQEFETSHAPPQDRGANRQQIDKIVEGILLEDLDATDDPEAPAKALFQIKTPAHLSDRWVDEIKPSQITVLNRTPSLFLAGSIGVAIELYEDKWWFISTGTSQTLRHAIVQEQLDCGWYTMEIARWTGTAPSGSASGSAEACNPCLGVVGAGTSSCGLTISYPTPQLTGTGVYVTAHDYQSPLISLVPGSGCLITTVANPAASTSGSGSGTGSATAASTSGSETIWHVTRGLQRHVVTYKERWDCCNPNGPWTLLARTPFVLVGIACDEILCGECPTSTSGS